MGKSRLVEELIREAGCPSISYVAIRESSVREVARFVDAIAGSDAPASPLVRAGAGAATWEAALELAVREVDRAEPLILVIDELPYLVDQDASIEATLQLAWDRTVRKSPVLLIVVGSDRATMESLSQEGRPLYDRPREMVIQPLSPAAVGDMLRLGATEALDAHLVTGGFPVLALEWGSGQTLHSYLEEALLSPTSFLVVSAERALAAEFPSDAQARTVLRAIGADARANREILQRTGLSGTSLQDALAVLLSKGVVERLIPYSATSSAKTARYVVADPYLRFWLRFVGGSNIDLIERGCGRVVVERFEEAWPTYRGSAIEPVTRHAIERLLPDLPFGNAVHVGGFWTRNNAVEVDLVGGDKFPVASSIPFVGSIKWRDKAPFTRADARALAASGARVPGTGDQTLLVGVSRSGFEERTGLDLELGPEELLQAFR